MFTDCVSPNGTSTDILQLDASNGYGAGLALGMETDSFAGLILALNAGDIYIDMHTALYPSGEIRGQLAASQALVPEPPAAWLFGLGVMILAVAGGRGRGRGRGRIDRMR